ncbi:MAG: flagellar biosynthetic protein FliO [Gammaproteobacteria bacterium]|nr:flagellar biosynthetic protein FliO [Gammaproteobacteria bacterium]
MLLVKQNVLKSYVNPVIMMAAVMAAPVNASTGPTAPDYLNMLLSLLLVIGLIFTLAMLAKRFNIGMTGQGAIKQVATLSVGAKERLIIVEVGDQQYLIGVTSQQVQLIEKLPHKVEAASVMGDGIASARIDSLFNRIKKGNS